MSITNPQNIDDYLAVVYRDHITKESMGDSISLLANAIKSNPEIKSQAEQKFASLKSLAASCGNLKRRCYVSSVQMDALDEAFKNIKS